MRSTLHHFVASFSAILALIPYVLADKTDIKQTYLVRIISLQIPTTLAFLEQTQSMGQTVHIQDQ